MSTCTKEWITTITIRKRIEFVNLYNSRSYVHFPLQVLACEKRSKWLVHDKSSVTVPTFLDSFMIYHQTMFFDEYSEIQMNHLVNWWDFRWELINSFSFFNCFARRCACCFRIFRIIHRLVHSHFHLHVDRVSPGKTQSVFLQPGDEITNSLGNQLMTLTIISGMMSSSRV